jgi:hypothetical protein
MGASKNRVTLKALANFSPGFALKPWVQKCKRLFATLKGLRGFVVTNAAQLFQSCAFEKCAGLSQGCQSATLGWNWRTLSALFIFCKSSQKWVAFQLIVQSSRGSTMKLGDWFQ